MANYYYVKNGGTATGDGGMTATQRTSTWNTTTSEYYDDLQDAVQATTTPTDGDFIFISDVASSTFTTNTSNLVINGSGASDGVGLQIISVDDTNQDQYKPGAIQKGVTTLSDRIEFDYNGLVAGVTLWNDYHIVSNASCRNWTFIDCSLAPGAESEDLYLNTDGSSWTLINTEVDLSRDQSGVPGFIGISNGAHFTMHGGSIKHYAGTSSTAFNLGSANGGATVNLYGVDISTTESYLVLGLTTAFSNDPCSFKFYECELHNSVSVTDSLASNHFHIELYNCDDSTSDDYHRFHVQTGAGTASNNDATYVTATETWYEDTAKSSIEVITTSICSHVNPFTFSLPAQYIDLATSTTDVVYVDLLVDNTAVTLTDTDIAFFLKYPDGTTAVTSNWLTTGKTVGTGNFGTDPLAAGTTLTNTGGLSDSSWTKSISDVNATQYRVKLDTSADVGQATAVSIYVEVYKASIASGDFFIHPLLTVSGT